MIDEHTYNDGTWNNPDLSEPSIEEQDIICNDLWQQEINRASRAKSRDEIKRAIDYGLKDLIPNQGDKYEEHN